MFSILKYLKNFVDLLIFFKIPSWKKDNVSSSNYNFISYEAILKNFIKKIFINEKQRHKFHIVSISPWPIFSSISALIFLVGLLSVVNNPELYKFKIFSPMIIGFFCIIISMFFWFRDIIREGSFLGYHTRKVQNGLKIGFILFLISEVMFFFSLFWAYFHSSLNPSIWIGAIWPPEGIVHFYISENIDYQTTNQILNLHKKLSKLNNDYSKISEYDQIEFLSDPKKLNLIEINALKNSNHLSNYYENYNLDKNSFFLFFIKNIILKTNEYIYFFDWKENLSNDNKKELFYAYSNMFFNIFFEKVYIRYCDIIFFNDSINDFHKKISYNVETNYLMESKLNPIINLNKFKNKFNFFNKINFYNNYYSDKNNLSLENEFVEFDIIKFVNVFNNFKFNNSNDSLELNNHLYFYKKFLGLNLEKSFSFDNKNSFFNSIDINYFLFLLSEKKINWDPLFILLLNEIEIEKHIKTKLSNKDFIKINDNSLFIWNVFKWINFKKSEKFYNFSIQHNLNNCFKKLINFENELFNFKNYNFKSLYEKILFDHFYNKKFLLDNSYYWKNIANKIINEEKFNKINFENFFFYNIFDIQELIFSSKRYSSYFKKLLNSNISIISPELIKFYNNILFNNFIFKNNNKIIKNFINSRIYENNLIVDFYIISDLKILKNVCLGEEKKIFDNFFDIIFNTEDGVKFFNNFNIKFNNIYKNNFFKNKLSDSIFYGIFEKYGNNSKKLKNFFVFVDLFKNTSFYDILFLINVDSFKPIFNDDLRSFMYKTTLYYSYLYDKYIGSMGISFDFKQKKDLYLFKSTWFFNVYDSGSLINPNEIPWLNTALLITSGITITVSHKFFKERYFYFTLLFLLITIVLSFFFLKIQFSEYIYSSFAINDGIYGTLFYMLTGFHGFHVMVGTIFLLVCFFRLLSFHFIKPAHLGFEAAIWYWHFVDVIWIFLYFFVYLWPNFYFFTYHFDASLVEDFYSSWEQVFISPDVLIKYHPVNKRSYDFLKPTVLGFDFYFSFPNFLYEANFSKYSKFYKNWVIKRTYLEYAVNNQNFKTWTYVFPRFERYKLRQTTFFKTIKGFYRAIISFRNSIDNTSIIIEKELINFIDKMVLKISENLIVDGEITTEILKGDRSFKNLNKLTNKEVPADIIAEMEMLKEVLEKTNFNLRDVFISDEAYIEFKDKFIS